MINNNFDYCAIPLHYNIINCIVERENVSDNIGLINNNSSAMCIIKIVIPIISIPKLGC